MIPNTEILRKERVNLATALNSLITMVTGAWGTIVAWTPILIAAAFAVIGFCISGICKIIGVRKRGRGRR